MSDSASRMQRPRAADLALLLMVVGLCLGVAVSPLPQTSARAATYLVPGMALYLALTRVRAPGRLLPAVALSLAALQGMLSALMIAALWAHGATWGRQDLLQALVAISRSANPNVLAGAVVVLLPFSLAAGTSRHGARLWSSWGIRVVALGSIAAAAPAVRVAQSRGAVLGTLAGIVAFVLLVRAKSQLWPVLLSLLSGMLVSVGGSLLGYQGRATELLGIAGTEARIEIWHHSLRMLLDFPLTGVGLGCVRQVMTAMYPLVIEPGGTANHAHNLFLQVGLDLGVFGLVGYVTLLVVAARALLRNLRSTSTPRTGPDCLSAACLASLVAMTVHGMLDAAVWGNKLAFIPWIVLGLATILSHAPQHVVGTQSVRGTSN